MSSPAGPGHNYVNSLNCSRDNAVRRLLQLTNRHTTIRVAYWQEIDFSHYTRSILTSALAYRMYARM